MILQDAIKSLALFKRPHYRSFILIADNNVELLAFKNGKLICFTAEEVLANDWQVRTCKKHKTITDEAEDVRKCLACHKEEKTSDT